MMRTLPLITVTILLLTMQNGFAQKGVASQKARVFQHIGETQLTVHYSRPVARGRTLFGENGLIAYGNIWMPGANDASNIEISTDVQVNGQKLEAGRYSIWTIPGQQEWIIIFSKDWDRWHTSYPGEDEDALRLNVTPEEGSHIESLAFYFPEANQNYAIFRLHWGRTIIPLKIEHVN